MKIVERLLYNIINWIKDSPVKYRLKYCNLNKFIVFLTAYFEIKEFVNI